MYFLVMFRPMVYENQVQIDFVDDKQLKFNIS